MPVIALVSNSSARSSKASRFTIKGVFNRIFAGKVSKKTEERFELEAELVRVKSALEAEQDKNACLVQHVDILSSELAASKQQAIDQKICSEKLSEKHLGIIEKLSREKKVMAEEHAYDKATLIRQLQTANQVITEFKNVEAQLEKLQDLAEVEQELAKEHKNLKNILNKYQSLMKNQLKKEVEKNGEVFSWQCCEICLERYSNEEKATPRILACGHTVCLGCAERLSTQNVIKCPFDRQGTQYKGKIENALPKNYSILDMC
ncbi:hypothetical protein CAEBREN_20844 [Caenorhabditis brenneri]|uniref:RING-type domain-containing protein n=1 Tax=Caenorhabditis brenneri TaxID=135651 RepID=G0MUL2_CAEBE|nr:hypothetical protein CAEBREN_20844 [Caenorhabditis brenneri]